MKIEVSNEQFLKRLVKKYGFTFNEKRRIPDFDYKVLNDDELIELINRFFRDEGYKDYIVKSQTEGMIKYVCGDEDEVEITVEGFRDALIDSDVANEIDMNN
jgi:hypothetical protein